MPPSDVIVFVLVYFLLMQWQKRVCELQYLNYEYAWYFFIMYYSIMWTNDHFLVIPAVFLGVDKETYCFCLCVLSWFVHFFWTFDIVLRCFKQIKYWRFKLIRFMRFIVFCTASNKMKMPVNYNHARSFVVCKLRIKNTGRYSNYVLYGFVWKLLSEFAMAQAR